jgi:hypothetical protein
MERSIIEQMIENARKMLVILSDSEARYRADAEIEVERLLVEHGLAHQVRAIRSAAEERAQSLRRDSELLHRQISMLESMLTTPVSHTGYLHGIDLSKLDLATASLVRSGHLPTITQLGGQIENAAQSEDYGVALA